MKKIIKRIIKYIIIMSILTAAAYGGMYMYVQSTIIPVKTVVAATGDVSSVIKENGVVSSGWVSILRAKATYGITNVFFQVGDSVKEGDVLIATDLSTDSENVRSLEAQASGLRAQREQARTNKFRMESLYESGAISRSELDAAEAAEKELSAQILALDHTIRGAKGNVQSNTVEASASGVITDIFVAKNDTAVMGSPLIEISDMNDIYIKAELIAEDASKIKPGDKVVIVSNPQLSAQVTKIAPKAAESVSELGIVQKRVEVRIDAENTEGFILGGDMDIEIVLEEHKNVITIPKKAVIAIDKKDYVYTIEEDMAKLLAVTVGLKGDDVYEITSGVSLGMKVVVSPSSALVDGSMVKEGP